MVNLDKDDIKIDEEKIKVLLEKYGTKLRFSAGVEPYITLKINEKDEEKIISQIKELLQAIS